jgi:hypothetical protein
VHESERGEIADAVGELQRPGSGAAIEQDPRQVVTLGFADAVDGADRHLHHEVVDSRPIGVEAADFVLCHTRHRPRILEEVVNQGGLQQAMPRMDHGTLRLAAGCRDGSRVAV